jgi:hypothetical protein
LQHRLNDPAALQLNSVFACCQAFKSKDTVMFRFYLLSIFFVIALGVLSPNVYAVQRAHVSALAGSDANIATGCTVPAPCRTFQVAMSVVDPKGEVVALDSGGYGAVTTTKSISLIAPPGVYAGISVFPGANGVTIATPGISVVLRGITINGQGGLSGVSMSTGKQLTIENCVISNMSEHGVSIASSKLRVINSIISDNLVYGIYLSAGATANITRSIISGNAAVGIRVTAVGTDATIAIISDSVIDANGDGVSAESLASGAAAIATLYGSRITQNSNVGLYVDGLTGCCAVIQVAGNNLVNLNRIASVGYIATIAMR